MITVTAATGHYGRLVVEELLKRGVPADDIVAAVRDPHKAADLADRGVQVREADYDRPESLVPAFTGAGKLLLIPSAVCGQRYPQMQRAITAAAEAGAGLIAYASFVNTGTSTLRLGQEHKQAEAAIRASGLPFVLLRNGAYTEMYTQTLGPALQYGAILGSAGDGKLSAATRTDLAETAVLLCLLEDLFQRAFPGEHLSRGRARLAHPGGASLRSLPGTVQDRTASRQIDRLLAGRSFRPQARDLSGAADARSCRGRAP